MASFRRDSSGQAILVCAFLFAIIIAAIALMLNNIIYSNNMAYVGFMKQPKYDDLSLKQAILDEAVDAYAASGGNPAKFQARMDDYMHAINNVTVSKGKYLEFTLNDFDYPPVAGMHTTVSELSIYGKDYNKSYTISTIHAAPTPTPSPSPVPYPLNCVVSMGTDKTTLLLNGIDFATINVAVFNNTTSMYESNVQVDLHCSKGMFYDPADPFATPISSTITDANGRSVVRYSCNDLGLQILNASVGPSPSTACKNLSGNVYITCETPVGPGACGHDVGIGNPTAAHSSYTKKGNTVHYVTVSVPITIAGAYDFSDFLAMPTITGLSNLELLSVGDINGIKKNTFQGSSGYSGVVTVKLYWINYPSPYSVTLNVNVTAECNIDNVLREYSKTVSYNGPPPP